MPVSIKFLIWAIGTETYRFVLILDRISKILLPVAPCGAYGLLSEVSWSESVHSVVSDQPTDCTISTHPDMTARVI